LFLFLDFDGVLHPDPCQDEGILLCHLPRLEAILRDFPAVEIVISSSWRNTRDLSQLRSYFNPDIAPRIIGVTPFWRDHEYLLCVIGSYQRHVEIEAWLRASGRPWESWIALDDKPYWFRPFLPNLVACAPQTGLTDEVEIILRKKLSA